MAPPRKKSKKKKEVKFVLLKDIVIPAGSVFSEAPTQTTRSECHFSHIVGLTKDTCGDLVYYINDDDPELRQYFTELKE